MVWKEIRIFVSNGEQSVIVGPNPEQDGIVMQSVDESVSAIYMTVEEATVVASELMKFVDEIKGQ